MNEVDDLWFVAAWQCASNDVLAYANVQKVSRSMLGVTIWSIYYDDIMNNINIINEQYHDNDTHIPHQRVNRSGTLGLTLARGIVVHGIFFTVKDNPPSME